MAVAGARPAGPRTPGERIEVDPEVLIRSGVALGALGTQLAQLLDALGAMLSGGIASGTDPAGFAVGLQYGDETQQFADTLAKGCNSFKAVGYKLQATGHNYENADAASTVGGSGPTGGLGGPPSETVSKDVPPGPNGSIVPPPTNWYLIQPFLRVLPLGLFLGAAMTWPSGNPDLLRVTAEQWHNLAKGFEVFQDEVAGTRTAVSMQQIPEGEDIDTALSQLGSGVSELSAAASRIGTTVENFGDAVRETQDAIRRLLDRVLSIDGALDTLTDFVTGEARETLREIARDVGTVLENFQRQVQGVVGLLGELTELLGDTATSFQQLAERGAVELLGEDVGGALSSVLKHYTDFQVGVATGLINTVAGTVAMADPATWQGMVELTVSVAKDPSTADDVALNMVKDFIAWDELTGDNPGRGVGEAGFNILSSIHPGSLGSKPGMAAKGINAARRAFGDPDPPSTDFPDAGPGDLDGLGAPPPAGSRAPDVPEVRPAAIPDSVIGPVPPDRFDAPPLTPRDSPEAPAVPSDPTGPTGAPGGREDHGGGGGSGPPPPPDPPGRSVGPPDPEPGRADSPPPGSPGSPEPAHPPYSPSSAEPSAPSPTPSGGEQTSPSSGQVPESPSRTEQPDSGRSAPEADSTPMHHESTEPPAHHGGVSGEGSHRADSGGAAQDHEGPTSDGTARTDERAHAPSPEHAGGQDRAADASHVREPAADDNHAKRQEPSGVVPMGMGGMGTPMGSHGSGASPSSPGGQPSALTPTTSDASTRNADGKGSHAANPGSPRAQQPVATGPSAGNTPPAPTTVATTHAAAGATRQPTLLSTEPRATQTSDHAEGHDRGVGDARRGINSSGPTAEPLHLTGSYGDDTDPNPVGGPSDAHPTGLSEEIRNEIKAIEHGHRPDPSTYLTADYLEAHRAEFSDGASRFVTEANFNKYGIAQRDGTSFVMPTHEADALLAATKGEPRALERSLGLPEGFLDDGNIKRIDIPRPEDYGLRIPSGNEAGANEQWIPGGYLPSGAAEAVIDGCKASPGTGYIASDLEDKGDRR